jgi:uncharacterized delta-60 repeat protein
MEMAMKKIFMLLAAVLIVIITGCGGSSSTPPLSSAKAITAFNIVSPVAATGVITEATQPTITIILPYGTSVTNLVATFTTTGTSVKVGSTVQVSGETENDFSTGSLTYTVTAADGSTQDYTVTVTVSPLSGSLDTTFGNSGIVTTSIGSGYDNILALGIQSDSRIVAAGYSSNGSNYDIALVRYNTDGSLDTTFGNSGIVTTSIGSSYDNALALGIQSDGKIVVAGSSYDNTNSQNDFALVRYNTDGSLDTTFGNSGIVTTSIRGINSINDYASALGIQSSDGKIVVAGYSFNSNTNKYDFALVRYNANGSLDTSGTPGIGFGTTGIVTTSIGNINDSPSALGFQSDGKIVVAGYYFYTSSKNNFVLVRYNTDGSLDTSGTPGIGFGTTGIVTTSIGNINDEAHALVIQSDDKIVVAGSSYDNNSSKYNFALVRYNADGSLDADPVTGFGSGGIVTTSIGIVTATSGSGFAFAYALGIQSDGKIVAAGSSNNGSNYDFALVRYNTDGSLDTGFGIGGIVTTPIGNSDDYALALGIQPVGTSDFRIVVAGYSYNENGSNYDFALVGYLP